MKISKGEVVALTTAITEITHALGGMTAGIDMETINALRERAEVPDGPYDVAKSRDQRGHRVWVLVTQSRKLHHDIDEYDNGNFNRWYYEKADAIEACASLNALIANHEKSMDAAVTAAVDAIPHRFVCTWLFCGFKTMEDGKTLVHEQENPGHITAVNAKWKQQNPDQRLL